MTCMKTKEVLGNLIPISLYWIVLRRYPYCFRFLNTVVKSPLWIGYKDKASDGTWSWIDGSTTVYTNWDTSNKADQKQTDCVILDSEDGKWRDVPCNEKHKFLCKKTGGEYVNIQLNFNYVIGVPIRMNQGTNLQDFTNLRTIIF